MLNQMYLHKNSNRAHLAAKLTSFSIHKNPPDLETILTAAPAFTGDHITAVKKYDSGFKEVLQKIHERTPGSELNKTSSQM